MDTGPAGENDPNQRAIARIVTSEESARAAIETPFHRNLLSPPASPPGVPWLGDAEAGSHPQASTFPRGRWIAGRMAARLEFFITVDGQTPAAFDPKSGMPNIVAQQGTVEDWIIENRSNELHAFHIHQLHFLLLDYLGRAVNEPYLRDTVNVPYYNGRSLVYPSIRLRMDFRDPDTIPAHLYITAICWNMRTEG